MFHALVSHELSPQSRLVPIGAVPFSPVQAWLNVLRWQKI